MQLYIRRCFIICMCKILFQNFIIKDSLKKNNDAHWISVWTVVKYIKASLHYYLNHQCAYLSPMYLYFEVAKYQN